MEADSPDTERRMDARSGPDVEDPANARALLGGLSSEGLLGDKRYWGELGCKGTGSRAEDRSGRHATAARMEARVESNAGEGGAVAANGPPDCCGSRCGDTWAVMGEPEPRWCALECAKLV